MDLEISGSRAPADEDVDLVPETGKWRLGAVRSSRTLLRGVQPGADCLGSSLPGLTPNHRG